MSAPLHGDPGNDTHEMKDGSDDSLHPARRSAERVRRPRRGDRPDAVDPRTAELLELVGARALRCRSPAARPEFVADLREQLMLAAETELVAVRQQPTDLQPSAHRRPAPYAAASAAWPIALGGFAIVGATASMAVAAAERAAGRRALPGQAGHRERRGRLPVSDDAKGQTILANASGRLDEVDALAVEGAARRQPTSSRPSTTSPSRPPRPATCCSPTTQNTGSEDSISELRDFTAEQHRRRSARSRT